MKKEFTIKEMQEKKGCYSMEELMALPFMNQEVITIQDILLSEIPLQDKKWMVYTNCEISLKEKKSLGLQLAWMVLPIYENKYPNDLRIRECLETVELFKIGKTSIDILREKRRAIADAADADAAAAAAAAAADAVYADANDAAYADANDAAYAVANDAAYAAYAAYAAAAAADAADAKKISYKEKYLQILLDFFN